MERSWLLVRTSFSSVACRPRTKVRSPPPGRTNCRTSAPFIQIPTDLGFQNLLEAVDMRDQVICGEHVLHQIGHPFDEGGPEFRIFEQAVDQDGAQRISGAGPVRVEDVIKPIRHRGVLETEVHVVHDPVEAAAVIIGGAEKRILPLS